MKDVFQNIKDTKKQKKNSYKVYLNLLSMGNTDLEGHWNQVQALGTDTQAGLNNFDLEVGPENQRDMKDVDRPETVHFLAVDSETHHQMDLKRSRCLQPRPQGWDLQVPSCSGDSLPLNLNTKYQM